MGQLGECFCGVFYAQGEEHEVRGTPIWNHKHVHHCSGLPPPSCSVLISLAELVGLSCEPVAHQTCSFLAEGPIRCFLRKVTSGRLPGAINVGKPSLPHAVPVPTPLMAAAWWDCHSLSVHCPICPTQMTAPRGQDCVVYLCLLACHNTHLIHVY